MKRVVSCLLVLAVLFGGQMSSAAAADADVVIQIDQKVQRYAQPPILVDGTTLVPLRGIFETLGAKVEWDAAARTVKATKGKLAVTLQIGSPTAYKNGTPVPLLQAPRIVNGSTLVPLRFVSEALGGEVQWRGDTRTVAITSPEWEAVEAAGKGDAVAVRGALDLLGVDANAAAGGETLLLAAVRSGSRELVEELIAAGADVNRADGQGLTPIMAAALCHHHELVAPLAKARADLNRIYAQIDMTPLMYAAFTARMEDVQAFLEAGARTDVKNRFGYTALKFAEQMQSVEIIKVLRASGAVE